MKNKWKSGFFLLLGLNVLVTIIILSMIMTPANQDREKKPSIPNNGTVEFYIKSNKEDLNKLINHYLKKEAAYHPIDYQINLDNEVELYGKLPFFSEVLNMKLTFEPKALENGDLVLKQKSISIGNLHLPVAFVLKFIRENYKLPTGVDIRPIDKVVYVNMQQLKLKSDIRIKVVKFNLKKDDIAFRLVVPVK